MKVIEIGVHCTPTATVVPVLVKMQVYITQLD